MHSGFNIVLYFAAGLIFAAIPAIMIEAFNTTSDLKTINFQDRHLLLEFIDDLACILITPQITPFLRESTKKFANNFVTTYAKDLAVNITEIDKFASADQIVLDSYGFVE